MSARLSRGLASNAAITCPWIPRSRSKSKRCGSGADIVRVYYSKEPTMSKAKKKPRGRPSKLEPPERIDADPETIAAVVLQSKPKKAWAWRFKKKAKQPDRPAKPA